MRNIIWFIVLAACIAVSAAVAVRYVEETRSKAEIPTTPTEVASEGDSPQWQVVQKWIQSAGPGNRSALRVQVLRPGIILPPRAQTYPSAPDDLSIVVTRRGNAPAQIEASQGARHWSVTENELDRLPPAIRLHVQRPLGWVLDGPAAEAAMADLITPTPGAIEPAVPASERVLDQFERRLDEMNNRVEALLKAMEDKNR